MKKECVPYGIYAMHQREIWYLKCVEPLNSHYHRLLE